MRRLKVWLRNETDDLSRLILITVLLAFSCFLSFRLENVRWVSYNRMVKSGECVILSKKLEHKVLIIDNKVDAVPPPSHSYKSSSSEPPISEREDLYRATAEVLVQGFDGGGKQKGVAHSRLSGRFSRSKIEEEKWISKYHVPSQQPCFYNPAEIQKSGSLRVVFNVAEALGEVKLPDNQRNHNRWFQVLQIVLGLAATSAGFILGWRLWVGGSHEGL